MSCGPRDARAGSWQPTVTPSDQPDVRPRRPCSTTCAGWSRSSRRRYDLDAVDASAAAVAALIERRLGSPRRAGRQPRRPARALARAAASRGCCSSATTTPCSRSARWPPGRSRVADGRATGPGVFDMKGGIVLGVHAVAALADRVGVELLFTADEEVGSGASRALIEERAPACGAVLVLEPAADGGA